ncbi:restriction endonuclease subunit S [Francisella philomiragia]|uniref:restriction endonuclease subunit S n=1 Tax=Francisella philomiragia TaxID=28110 RepID=UPI001C9D8E1D|nr:restriction endonuclease subunit S [Francisella philomiragia]MBY7733708.1 restriction endonuclease subunit S [Francisella philomiragia]
MAEYKLDSSVDNNKVFLVNYSELENRIDPHPYHKERFNVISALEKIKCEQLKKVAKFSKRITNKVSDGDIYIGLENIESNTGSYIETESKDSVSSANIFVRDQILFPKLRPYLNKVYLASFNGLCSTEFHILESALDFLKNKYLYIYLQSNLVVSQTKHLMTGNTLPRLQTEDIKNIPIPLPSLEIQNQIIQKYEQAYQQKQQKEQKAKELLASIDSYLLDKLGIELPEKDNSLQARIFTTNFSEVSGGRFDSFYNNQRYKFIDEQIELSVNKKYKLKELCYPTSGVVYSRNDETDIGKAILRANNITLETNELNFESIRYVRESLNISDSLKLRKNDILMSSASGSKEHVGKVAYIYEDLDYYFGGFMTILRQKDNRYNQKFLFEYLQSKIFREYLFKNLGGTNINNLSFSAIANLEIPLPPLTPAQAKTGEISQQEIVEHISAIRAEAKKLQEEAIADLEATKAEIEKMILR